MAFRPVQEEVFLLTTPKYIAEMKRILIIAPHADDEVLGCGGYMLSEAEKGSEIYILIGTIGGSDRRQPFDQRLAELKSVCDIVGAKYSVIVDYKDALLDTVDSRTIINAIDESIEAVRPDELFINYPSRHQDHVKMYECALAALRLKEGFMPPMVALYEYPFILNHYDKIDGGRWYHDISDSIKEKVALFYKYTTQVKRLPSPLNEEGIETLARTRGLECGCKYAEMFYIQKLVK